MTTADRLRYLASIALVIATFVLLWGCTAAPIGQTISKAVPLACDEKEPTRPVMPCDALMRGATVDDWVKCSGAEIKRREGYEGKLVTALRNCIAPIAP